MPQFSMLALNWLSQILKERFGHEFNLTQDKHGLKLMLLGVDQGCILFPKLETAFHESRSDFPCAQWDAKAEGFQSVMKQLLPAPCVNELSHPLIEKKKNHAVIHYDILGLAYWMLNRIEEIGRTDLDNHQRFPAVNSHAYQYDYLERPIVDEWLYILGQVIKQVWPSVELKQHQFSIKVSHDVDSPSLYAFKPWKTIIRMMVGHLLKRRDLKAALQAFWIKLIGHRKIPKQDPFNTFEWLMDVSDSHNLTSAFYFICGTTSNMDADYQPEDPRILKLMKRIHERGHEIGLHPSYGTYQEPKRLKQEAERLSKALQQAGINQAEIGGRMHYLRWQQPITLQAWSDAGMAYDSTLSYADRPGFRCGTCHEYPAFNPVTQKPLEIRIRPLIAMECTVIDDVYLGLGESKAAQEKFLKLKDQCCKVGGCFTLLWHNSYLAKQAHFNIYQIIISDG